jgi:Asp/Glu/hydantoin racemase
MILAKAAAVGLAGQLGDVCFLPFSIPEMIADRESRLGAVTAAVRACAEAGAEAVLLGGAPFAGLAASLARKTGLIVLDGVEASVVRLVGAVNANHG